MNPSDLSARGPLARCARLLFAVLLGVTPLTVLAPPPAYAVATLQLVDPVTDNYKTWADDRTPGHTDNRTSLLFDAIRVGDETYVVPQSVRDSYGSRVGAPSEWDAVGGMPLARSVGGPVVARLKFDHDGGNAWSYFRLWPGGTFGPLMTINRAAFVSDPHPPVAGTFTLTSTAGAVLATRAMRYRYDPAIAALPETSVEWHGPLGRWYAGTDTAAPTPLNWPSGIAVSGTPSGTHQPRVEVTAGEADTVYVAPVDLAGLAVARVPEALTLAWSPAGAGRPTSAPAGAGWRPVSVTLPEGSYGLQASGTCQSACRYDMQPQALGSASSTVMASAAQVATYQPDAEIRTGGGTWSGAGVVNTNGAGQTVDAAVPLGSSQTFEVRVTNTGSAIDTFGLADASAGTETPFTYRWRYLGTDVTSQVHDDGWFVLADVPVGGSRLLELTVTPKSTSAVGATAQYALHAYHSPASAGIKDVVGLALNVASAEDPPNPDYDRPPGAPEVPIQPCSRYAAPEGDDANPGTAASPVLTLSRLTAVLAPGQTGCLQDGGEIVQTEDGTGVMAGGSPGQPKIIRPETVGQRARVRGVTKFLVPDNANDLILMDLDIRGSPDVGGGNLFHVNGDRVMLDGIDLSWPRNICLGVGAEDEPAKDFVLIDSRIHDCGATHDNDPNNVGGAHGAYLQYVRDSTDADTWGAIVYNTLFDHNDGRGLQLYPDADDVLVDGAVLYGNGSNLNIGSDSVDVRSQRSRIRNTILANSRLDFDDPEDPNPSNSNDIVGNFSGAGNDGADNRIGHSCLSNTVRPGYLFDSGGTGNVVLEDMTYDPPTFVDVAGRDFQLTSGSACQGMGLSDASRLPGGSTEPPPPPDEPLFQEAPPSIQGKLRVGRTLTAFPGTWAPSPDGYRYEWFVGGNRVDGPAGGRQEFLLRKRHRGEQVAVRIDVLAPEGYLDTRIIARRDGRVQ